MRASLIKTNIDGFYCKRANDEFDDDRYLICVDKNKISWFDTIDGNGISIYYRDDVSSGINFTTLNLGADTFYKVTLHDHNKAKTCIIKDGKELVCVFDYFGKNNIFDLNFISDLKNKGYKADEIMELVNLLSERGHITCKALYDNIGKVTIKYNGYDYILDLGVGCNWKDTVSLFNVLFEKNSNDVNITLQFYVEKHSKRHNDKLIIPGSTYLISLVDGKINLRIAKLKNVCITGENDNIYNIKDICTLDSTDMSLKTLLDINEDVYDIEGSAVWNANIVGFNVNGKVYNISGT